MKTQEIKEYRMWLSSENMHRDTQKWLSELEFIKDEQMFFNDLIKSYTLQLIDSEHFQESKKVTNEMTEIQQATSNLLNEVKNHDNGLEVMVDGLDEYEKEEAYRGEHRELIAKVETFLNAYNVLKTQLFTLVKGVIKSNKQKRLLE
ncbi:hypothetical protein [Aestuariibaculum sediminum]|uniref:Uncharacterized protein n=1 Tax=Aestuariibaculum sediminum TaxID=2770637 RepID=A0A8J6U8T5_9FLAO|nr:hypothetical protein [Aestuariibaculum sediminum]MBD0833428.1 hypothetical protein [Aestuariibaculum sediminum]